MKDPVTVFMLMVSGLLVVGTVGEQIFARTGVPAVIWLILLGVFVRIAGVVPDSVVTMLAPYFAALALVLILFDAGRHLSVGTGDPSLTPTLRRKALVLALAGVIGTTLLVALLSMGLYGLNVLPQWGWTHAFMLGSLMSAGAGEVFMPTLQTGGSGSWVLALLRREAAITKALAVVGTVLFIDLLSPRIAGGVGLGWAMGAGFGFALLFGIGAGITWVFLLQWLAGNPRSYMFTLSAMFVLYVLSEVAGGSGPLSVLVFGLVIGNAEGVLALMMRRRGEETPAVASEIPAALADHEGTIQFVRTLVFAMVGLLLMQPSGPDSKVPIGALVFGVAVGFIPVLVRLLAVRFVLSSSGHAERTEVGYCAPRGMATVALATLALAHGVPGNAAMLTLVLSAVTTSVVVFTISMRHARTEVATGELAEQPAARPIVMRAPGAAFVSQIDVRAPTLPERREDIVEAAKASAAPVAPVAAPPKPATVVDAPLEDLTPLPAALLPSIGFVAPVDEAPKPRTGPRAPLVGMQEQPGTSGPVDPEFAVKPKRAPEVFMPTLPSIDAAAQGENPLDSAMVRALSKRPEDVVVRGGRSTVDVEAIVDRADKK